MVTRSHTSSRTGSRCREQPLGGFTLIELLVVLAIIASLVTLALPRYLHSAEHGKEAVLKEDLSVMRQAIDKYRGDRGAYPQDLDELVTRGYLRKVPPDPITESTTSWLVVPYPDGSMSGVYDVRSGAAGKTLDDVEFGAL
jgi:general secretion pathway protein G